MRNTLLTEEGRLQAIRFIQAGLKAIGGETVQIREYNDSIGFHGFIIVEKSKDEKVYFELCVTIETPGLLRGMPQNTDFQELGQSEHLVQVLMTALKEYAKEKIKDAVESEAATIFAEEKRHRSPPLRLV